jgi:hypothetical protein
MQMCEHSPELRENCIGPSSHSFWATRRGLFKEKRNSIYAKTLLRQVQHAYFQDHTTDEHHIFALPPLTSFHLPSSTRMPSFSFFNPSSSFLNQ